MKNREKYREELINIIKLEPNGVDTHHSVICDFVKSHVLKNYEIQDCSCLWCITCNKMFSFWLDEEYEEPPKPEVDWNNVPVDTLVRVRDSLNKEWKLAFFKGFYPHKEFKFETWANAETSKTGRVYEGWMFCELVED